MLLVIGCVTREGLRRDSSCAPSDGLYDQGGVPRVLLVMGCVTREGFLVCS